MNIESTARIEQAEKEMRWEKAYRSYEIEKELKKARILCILRVTGRALGILNPGKRELTRAAFAPAGAPFRLPIDQVVGFLDEQTGLRRSLLLKGNEAARLWKRIYIREEGELRPLVVAERKEGWDIVGGTADLVQLEVLRAKGKRSVSVVRKQQEDEQRCEGCEDLVDPAGAAETRATA